MQPDGDEMQAEAMSLLDKGTDFGPLTGDVNSAGNTEGGSATRWTSLQEDGRGVSPVAFRELGAQRTRRSRPSWSGRAGCRSYGPQGKHRRRRRG